MLIFGIEVPLVEVMVILVVMLFVLLVESLIVLTLLLKYMNKTKELSEMIGQRKN